jgi:hypothetical protein
MMGGTAKKVTADIESHTLIDPLAFEKKDLVSRLQNWMADGAALNDIERSFKDFKRKECSTRFLLQYNTLLEALRKEKYQEM